MKLRTLISAMAAFLLLAGIVNPFNATSQNKVNLIDTNDKFTKDDEIKSENSFGEKSKIESGVINGVTYRFYYSDGSGMFAGKPGSSLDVSSYKDDWMVACKKDAIHDTKYCYMSIKDLKVYIYGDGKQYVTVGKDNYPGSEIVIRFGSEPAIRGFKGTFTLRQNRLIVEKLKTAKKITTRYVEWPYNSDIDTTWELYGFNETYQYIKWALSKIK